MISRCLWYTAILCLLAACGAPDSRAPSAATPASDSDSSELAIAQLLRSPPSPGTAVTLDVYVWQGWSFGEGGAPGERDPQGCPVRTGATMLLVDQPTPWMIPVLGGRTSNSSNRFPPDGAAWLVVGNPLAVPYHARVRGQLGGEETAHCAMARHIFIVEQVLETYAELPPELTGSPQPPADYASWQRYHDAELGYQLRYPPGWVVEPIKQPDTIAAFAIHDPHNADFPILVRVYDGETHYDQYDVAHTPPLLQRVGRGPFSLDSLPFAGTFEHQALFGYYRDFGGSEQDDQQIAVIFSNYGRSYELFLRYPIGLDARTTLPWAYTFVVLSFGFDRAPGPSPTPPIRQVLGAGPFLTADQLLGSLRLRYGAEAKLLDSQLVSEAEARQKQKGCSTFQGHIDGIWLVTLYGQFEGMWGTSQLVLNAATGEELCSEFAADLSRPTAVPSIPTSTPAPEPSPYPAPLGTP